MATGTLPSDQAAFFAADIGETRYLGAAAVSVALAEKLTPGRWFIQVVPTDPTAQTWIQVDKFDPAVPLVATVGVGLKKVPIGPAVNAFEFVVRDGYNDALAAICSAGSADVWLTHVSRRA